MEIKTAGRDLCHFSIFPPFLKESLRKMDVNKAHRKYTSNIPTGTVRKVCCFVWLCSGYAILHPLYPLKICSSLF